MFQSRRNGVTLVEVLVAVAIVALVIGLLLPATRRVREPAARMKCTNNLRQLMIGLHSYHSNDQPEHYPSTSRPEKREERFPTGCIGPGATPEERLSWMVDVLPFVEQDVLWKKFDVRKGYVENLPASQTIVRVFLCADSKGADPTGQVTQYVAISGIGLGAASQPAKADGNGFMGYDRLTSLDAMHDGTSNTIALMETRSNLGPWARGGASNLRGFDPADEPPVGDQRPFGGHKSGMNVAMADGSVQFIRNSIQPSMLAAAITIAGGESVNLD